MTINVMLDAPAVRSLIGDNDEVRIDIAKGAISILTKGLAKQVATQIAEVLRQQVRDQMFALIRENTTQSYHGHDRVLSEKFKKQVGDAAVEAVEMQLVDVRKIAEERSKEIIAAKLVDIDNAIDARVNRIMTEEINRRVNEKFTQLLANVNKLAE